MFISPARSAEYRPALAWFSAIGGAWVFVLVTLGAFTTSIGAGMVFQDWPLSNGSLNPHGWLSNLAMFAEHSHRLSAGLMTLITMAIALWIWRTDDRPWLRTLAWAAVALVLVQALVGGLRVLLEHRHVEMVNTSVGRLFAMLHAVLAQVFVCTLLAIAAACSCWWRNAGRPAAVPGTAHLRRLGLLCCTLLVTQLAIAAVMRHSFAGFAIPTFPHSTPSGGWLPAAWDFRVGIHFAHRLMALALAIALPWFAIEAIRARPVGGRFKAGALAVVVLLCVQILLGAYVVWSGRNAEVTTAHVIVGASLLSVTFLLTWVMHRTVLEQPAQQASRARADVPAKFLRA